MRLGKFLRTDKNPIRLRVGEDIISIKKGEVIVADYDIYKDIWGFRFIGWYIDNQINVNNETPKEINGQRNSDIKVTVTEVSVTAPNNIPSLTKQELLEQALQEKEQINESVVNNSDNQDPIEEDIFAKVKKITGRQLFLMKKEQMMEYLDKLGIDYTNTSKSRNELLQILKKYIKEN